MHQKSLHQDQHCRRMWPLLAVAFGLSACTVGPDYQGIAPETPLAWSTQLEPSSTENPQPDWWLGFQDPTLTNLIDRATADNPRLEEALARVDRAAATVGVARADLFPQAGFFADAARLRTSGNRGGNQRSSESRYDLSTALGLAWEVDLWGRVRRVTASAVAEAEAEARAYDFSRILLQTGVAEAYLRLRILDRSIQLLDQTLAGRWELLEFAELRRDAGLGDDLEVAQARTEWADAGSELEALRRQRGTTQNALAVLLGTFPEKFALEPDQDWVPHPPPPPVTLPASLLQRRPDVAEAERLVAAASERIGARTAEYFPQIQITGDLGFAASDASAWFTRSSLFGSVGPSLSMPILSGGRIRSQVEQAEAEYRELLAAYQAQVLDAFRGVEDALLELKLLQTQIGFQQTAAESAAAAASLARQRFESGLVNYLDVIDTERVALSSKLRLIRVQGEQLTQQVQLIRELGGGWESPAPDPPLSEPEP